MREAHQEPIAPAHYAAVRARVLAELGRERRPLWRHAWAWGLAAAMAVVCGADLQVCLLGFSGLWAGGAGGL